MRHHIEALFLHDAHGDLVRGNEPNGGPAPRFFRGTTKNGDVWRFRHDVDAAARQELQAFALETNSNDPLGQPVDISGYEAVLARTGPVQTTWTGPAFSVEERLPNTGAVAITDVNKDLLLPLLHEWIPDVAVGQPMFACIVEGRAVAVCCSVRCTNTASEAGVETSVSHRGHGYAGRVTAAWVNAVRGTGRIPLYSTSWQNDASRAVARKLGLRQFGADLHIL